MSQYNYLIQCCEPPNDTIALRPKTRFTKQSIFYFLLSKFKAHDSILLKNVIFIMSKSHFLVCGNCEFYGKIVNRFPPGPLEDSRNVQCEELVIIIFDCFIKICGCWRDGMTWKLCDTAKWHPVCVSGVASHFWALNWTTWRFRSLGLVTCYCSCSNNGYFWKPD